MSVKNEKHLQELIKVVQTAAQDKDLLEGFLKDLFTPAEHREIVARWQIVKALDRGVPHQKIAEDLKVGKATVTRGARMLLNPTGGFNQLLKRS